VTACMTSPVGELGRHVQRDENGRFEEVVVREFRLSVTCNYRRLVITVGWLFYSSGEWPGGVMHAGLSSSPYDRTQSPLSEIDGRRPPLSRRADAGPLPPEAGSRLHLSSFDGADPRVAPPSGGS
jgi:hypothetical protein